MRPRFLLVSLLALLCQLGDVAVAQMTAEIPDTGPRVTMKLHAFLPFSAITEVLIRKQDIEHFGRAHIWFVVDHPFVRKLKSVLESRPTEKRIKEVLIRLKVEFIEDGDVFYMDRYGTIQKNSSEDFQLFPDELEELQKEIVYFIGVV